MTRKRTDDRMEIEGLTLSLTCGGYLGDQLCFLSAARSFARTVGVPTFVETPLPEVVAAYGDGLIRAGSCGPRVGVDPQLRHRVKGTSIDVNYAGTFLAAMGLRFAGPPTLEFPRVPRPCGLPPRYAVLQPRSVHAPNPPASFLQGVVDLARSASGTGMPIYAVGRPDGVPQLRGVELGQLGEGVTQFLSMIAHATFVLTPRSAAAHAAAAYGVPAVVWLPEDGENWHMDYPDWDACRLGFAGLAEGDGAERVTSFVRRYA